MNAILNALRHPVSERLGWSLIHLLWQGTVVAMLLAGLLWLLRRRSANSRYVAACAALLLLPTLLIVTYRILPAQDGSADTVRSSDKTTIETNAVVREADGGRAKRPLSEKIVVSRSAETILIPTVDPPRNPQVSNPEAPVEVLKGKPLTEERTVTGDVTVSADLAAPPQDTGQSLPAMLRGRVAKSIEPVLPWIVAAWMIGLLMLSAWHLRGWIGLRRLRHRGVSSVPDSVQSMLLRLQKRFAISRPVTMLQSSRVSVLSLLGILKPVILLPGSVLTGLTPQQLEAVLAHELAHVRRHDYLLNLLQTAIETLLFFHPAVWWISSRIRIERENCCDDLALAVTDDRLLYAQSLTRLEELRQQTAAPRPAALTLAATGGSLLDRIRRVLGVSRRPAHLRVSAVGVTGLSGLLAIAAALLFLLPGVISQAPAV
ncbi:MAG: M56 family metallopeptidase, partial [Planctomycetes bacterium]|nr:M56 family metallopeptidase [Planctomycetota bacterium]